ncbi:MAG: mannose-1-phosphate guanylyltransferase, partial [Leeuwenhoekiella sp.]
NFAVIMAGGIGSRFWPVSKKTNPKQFQDILGCGKTLIQTTFERVNKFIPTKNIFILTNDIYIDIVAQQLPEISKEQIVAEPIMRNTAPCILLAAMKIHKKDPKANMLIAPSDHWIQDTNAFSKDILLAFEKLNSEQKLITFGIQPTFPNTGYGYIKYEKGKDGELMTVNQFTEKPDFEFAQKFLKEGNYLWNSGIFVWKASTILEKFHTYLPEMYKIFQNGKLFYNTVAESKFLQLYYHQAENISIDYGIIEKTEEVFVIPASFSWNDLGTWCSLQEEIPADEADNTVVNSRFIPIESTGNIVRTETNKIVLVDGLSDFMILENKDVLLIVPKKKQQKIKQLRQSVMDSYGVQLG